MDVSLQLIFQNSGNWLDEREHVAAEQRLAELAEPLGFGTVFVVEHHFFDYSACPDNAQFLAWLAARTSRIRLATGAFILPWNQPLRVAEKIVLLDQLSAGAYLMTQSYGAARRILEQLRERWETIGPFDLSVIPRYGTLPPAKAEASLRRFAEQALPELRQW